MPLKRHWKPGYMLVDGAIRSVEYSQTPYVSGDLYVREKGGKEQRVFDYLVSETLGDLLVHTRRRAMDRLERAAAQITEETKRLALLDQPERG